MENGGGGASLSRVISDCIRALRAFEVVYKVGGRMMQNLTNRSDRCNHAGGWG